jgi:hypothetical protein
MDKFLDPYNHSKLNAEDISHLNRSIMHNEKALAIKHLQKKKSPETDGLSVEFYQTIKEELIILLKLFHEIKRYGKLPNSFYGASITHIPKMGKDSI